MKQHEHPLSWEALGRIVLMGLAILLLWKALGAVTIIIVALVLAVSLFPIVETLRQKTRMPMLFSILVIFIILLIPIFIVGITIIPNINSQFPGLITQINTTVKSIPFISNSLGNFDIGQYLQTHYDSLVNYSVNILFMFISVITVIVLVFYFIYDYERLYELFLNIFPDKEKNKLKGVLGEIAQVIGQYVRGNIVISIINIVIVYVGLLLLGIPFALPLAIFSGILDLLPLVGSTIGAIPALLIAFSISPIKGFFVLILHLVYQQVENVFISPVIYNKALDLYPAIVFLAIILGASLFGILGAFLALPIAASIPALLKYQRNHKNNLN